jgi:hypothetical protein
MYKLFIGETFSAHCADKHALKIAMDTAVTKGYDPSLFNVYQRKSHVTYTVGESKLVID